MMHMKSKAMEAIKGRLVLANSYTRIQVILGARGLTRRQWFSLLGQAWSICDNIGLYHQDLLVHFASATRADLNAMMSRKERRKWDALPELMTVFRGCSPQTIDGLSFSLNYNIAVKFPFLNRYKTKHPLIVTAQVEKRTTVLKLDRGEEEVIVTDPLLISISHIEPITKPVWEDGLSRMPFQNSIACPI